MRGLSLSPLHLLSLLLFALLCAGYFAVPLWDSDFWWHIASGREILHNGIPSVDPFGVFPATDAVRNDTVLKGQWLGQVVLYLLFDAGGVNAVIAFRVAVLMSCLALVWWRCQRHQVNPLALWLVLVLTAVGMDGFGGERPQLLSFLFAALFFAVIDIAERRKDKLRWLALLPLIAVLWANSHGGILLAVVLLGLWSSFKLFDAECGRREKIGWWAATGAVLLATLATPNGLQTYLYLLDLQGSTLQARTSEYISAFQLYTLGYWWPQFWVVVFYSVTLLAVFRLARQRRWRLLALTVFLAAIAISSFRYFMFLLIIAAPYIALGLDDILKLPASLAQRYMRPAHLLLSVVLAGLLVAGIVSDRLFRGGVLQGVYPVAIADFVSTNKLQGRAFNNLEWGGYLLWRLAPQVRLFIDGRMLDEARFPPYTHMLWATPQGKQWFEKENFQLVMMPYHGRYDPQRYPLIDYLLQRPDWRLVYRDTHGVVFVRQK